MRTFAFIIPPSVELLDFAGPAQVFTEAKFYGLEADIQFCSFEGNPKSTAGLEFGKVAHFTEAKLKEGDFIFVPGMDFEYVSSMAFKGKRDFFNWLKQCSDLGITVCSICNGAFALGHAGLLKDTQCTTHWRRVEALQEQFPLAKVLTDILYIKSNNVYTSAGISAGIDLALAILEDLKVRFLPIELRVVWWCIIVEAVPINSKASIWIIGTILIRKFTKYRIT